MGSVTADNNGNWNFTIPTGSVQIGTAYGFTTQATDLAGNVGSLSAAYTVTLAQPELPAPPATVSTAGLSTSSLDDDNIQGAAASYAVLYEGAGNHTLQINNITINGNAGAGNTEQGHDNGPSTINGRVDFSAANTGQFSNNNRSNIITGGVNYNAAAVTAALKYVNSLNATLGGETGTSVIAIIGTTTINVPSAGTLDANGNRVFTVSNFQTQNGNVLTINGDAAGDNVVLNFTKNVNFNNTVVLAGISPDQVLYNFVGGSNLSGPAGPPLQINGNPPGPPPGPPVTPPGPSSGVVQGVFLDPNGSISVNNSTLIGRIFGGAEPGQLLRRRVPIHHHPASGRRRYRAGQSSFQYQRDAHLQWRRDGELPGGGTRGRYDRHPG